MTILYDVNPSDQEVEYLVGALVAEATSSLDEACSVLEHRGPEQAKLKLLEARIYVDRIRDLLDALQKASPRPMSGGPKMALTTRE